MKRVTQAIAKFNGMKDDKPEGIKEQLARKKQQ